MPIDNGTCWDMFIGCVAVVECLLLLRVEHPVSQRQMGGRGGPGNYYAITHKPIDLDWTPGGSCCAIVGPSRFVTRPCSKTQMYSMYSIHSVKFLHSLSQNKRFTFQTNFFKLFLSLFLLLLLMLTHEWRNREIANWGTLIYACFITYIWHALYY